MKTITEIFVEQEFLYFYDMFFFSRFSGLKRNNSVVGICEGYFFELTN